MIKKLKVAFLFYRIFLLPSVVVNIILVLLDNPFAFSAFIKLGLAAFIGFWLKNSQRTKLVFYNNLSINNLQLFSFSYGIDLLLLVATYIIFDFFIYDF